MADDIPEGFHVDFEVLAVNGDTLLVRFRINDKHFDLNPTWDGKGDVIDFLKNFGPAIVTLFNRPPPVSFDLLQQQVGKQGHVDVPAPIP